MDPLAAVPVRLLPAFPLFDFRGVLELLFDDVYAVSAELLIVVQHRPGNPIMVRANAEEAPETQDRVGDAAAGFIDHKALDLPDALTVRVIDRSSFHPIACDDVVPCSVMGARCIVVTIVSSPRLPAPLLIRKPVPRPESLIGGPGALHSVASVYAVIAL